MTERGNTGYRLTRACGWLALLSAPLSGYLLALAVPALKVDALLFVGAMQGLAGAALVYAAGQKLAATDLGHKAFPATWVFFLFFLVMTWRLVADSL